MMDGNTQFLMICFDVRDEKRLSKVSNTLENYGTRVQRSVFECLLNNIQLATLKAKLERLINTEKDQIRYYALCPRDVNKILIDGPGTLTIDPDFMIV